jgi:hypothetical protein
MNELLRFPKARGLAHRWTDSDFITLGAGNALLDLQTVRAVSFE